MTDIPRMMLGLLPDEKSWIKKNLVSADGNSRCLLGAVSVMHIRMSLGECEPADIAPYLATLAQVIRAEYPGRACRYPYLGACCCGDNDVIIAFNDHDDTVFADVRMILEKAAAG
jgi:hypothetical protein